MQSVDANHQSLKMVKMHLEISKTSEIATHINI